MRIHTLIDLSHTSNYKGVVQSGMDVIVENFMDGVSLLTSINGYLLGIRSADIQKEETVYVASKFQDIKG